MYNQLNDSNKINILSICLDNICRSPATYAAMQHLIRERGCANRYMTGSTGIGSWHVGRLPDKRMCEHDRRHGYSVGHRVRQFGARKNLELFDKIVVMNEGSYRNITSQAPNEATREKVIRTADFFTQHPSATRIPDPHYGDTEDFNLALGLIEDGCKGILNII